MRSGTRRKRLLAAFLGIFSGLCALAVPFLPVVHETARITWPTAGDTTPVNAPLVAYWAQDLTAEFPCATIQNLDRRTPSESSVLFSTTPKERNVYGAGMQLDVDGGKLVVVNRGERLKEQPLPATGCDLRLTSTSSATKITMGDFTVWEASGDVRPRIVGIYTDIDAARGDPAAGLSVDITPDTRYQSHATLLKVVAIIFAVLAGLGCLLVVWRLDSAVARRAPRWLPTKWWRPTWRDVTVVGVLGLWVIIGPVTADDGYTLTMSRVLEDAGYMTNYYRWYGVAEAPIGWYFHLHQLMQYISTSPPWMRLIPFVIGVASWVLISREVMPRLGKNVRLSPAAGWAAAAVFLVWWLPYNNGLRSEPAAAVGVLLVLCAVERAVVTRRILPICLGLIAAAFSVAATPTGVIAVAPFLVAGRPLFKLVRSRAQQQGGWLPVLGPIFASGFLVLVVIFADQSFASVSEATRLRTTVGPALSWFQELERYQLLFSQSADGAIARRFPVLLLLLCAATCMVVLLRRGRIQGASLGPSRRLIGTVGVSFLMLALTPTKFTHHFGAFAALGAAMGALTALAISSTVLRSTRNRTAFLSALLVIAALATTGPNAYWYVSQFGVPWFDKPPSFKGISLSTVLLAAAGVTAIIAFVENVRAERPGAPPEPPERSGRALRLGSASLVIVCGLVVLGEFASMAKAIHKQRDSYSLGAANVRHLSGGTCNMSDYIRVEKDPASRVLRPLPDNEQTTKPKEPKEPPPQPPGQPPLPPESTDNGPAMTGFHPIASESSDPIVKPPHDFQHNTVLMWSSYSGQSLVGKLRTPWFALSKEDLTKQIVMAIAGETGTGITLNAEFGKRGPQGFEVVKSIQVRSPRDPVSVWRDNRLDLGGVVPPDVEAVRLTAEDNDLRTGGFMAVTAPRVPELTSLTERLKGKPVYMDWPVSFVHPCLSPAKFRDGIMEAPEYRITAGTMVDSDIWSNAKGGGPTGLLEETYQMPEIPTFLVGDEGRDWGELRQLKPYDEAAKAPTVVRGSEVRSGLWAPDKGPQQARPADKW
ncbi:arabinosyltransferase C [Herbihabitans rhizosphaerae]|uniref:Arabinosyltransferase C n=1 Tax=Herbihabitans rhizosphaerae TaxID=1872711 RepID=A0A4Q7KJF8_9PSEU|nr:arabinosyltransferase domain-containing protein [Herbihabitans rhizosphaerae]RZS36555.1 arabinosyltransferase C [Herbihabitans rhizosphaerae]